MTVRVAAITTALTALVVTASLTAHAQTIAITRRLGQGDRRRQKRG